LNNLCAKPHACEDEHIRQILVEGVQDSGCRAKGCKVQGCTAQGCKKPAVAVRTLVVPEEVVSNRLVAVGRIAAAVRTVAGVEQATGIHRSEDKVRAPACFAVGAAGAAQGMESS
jgi:hypothetical protein